MDQIYSIKSVAFAFPLDPKKNKMIRNYLEILNLENPNIVPLVYKKNI